MGEPGTGSLAYNCFYKHMPPQHFLFLFTSGDVHDMVEGVLALDDVHHHPGEAQVVLGEQGVYGDWLDHVAHEEESLGVLETTLC